MFVSAKVPSCDLTDRNYGKFVDGAYAIARGATGRWCAVMYVGPEWLAENKVAVRDHNEVVNELEAKNEFIDF